MDPLPFPFPDLHNNGQYFMYNCFLHNPYLPIFRMMILTITRLRHVSRQSCNNAVTIRGDNSSAGWRMEEYHSLAEIHILCHFLPTSVLSIKITTSVVTKLSPDYNFTWEPGANLPDASTPLVRMVLVTVQSHANAMPLLLISYLHIYRAAL